MVNLRGNPLSTADALFYDMSFDKELDNVILPLLDGFQEGEKIKILSIFYARARAEWII